MLFSLRAKPFGQAYADMIKDPRLEEPRLLVPVGVITIIVSTVLLVPTALWVRLRLPCLRPTSSSITLLPFVIPPVILVFGLI